MKKLISIIIVCVMIMFMFTFPPLSATAATEGYYTYTVSNGEATITDVDTSISGDITIPSTLGGYPVTTISYGAFYGCTNLTCVEISDIITTIDRIAFYKCDSLTSINVDKNNKNYSSIEGNLFNKNKTTLIQYAIGKTDSSYVIPDSVTKIGDDAFWTCDSLTRVEISNSVITIGDDAFGHCDNLLSVEIGNSVTTIGNSAFLGCTGLTNVVIGNSVTIIGNSAFNSCDSLTSVEIGNGVNTISVDAFRYCDSLTSINVDKNNKNYCSIDGNLFNKNKTTLIQYAIGKADSSYIIPDSVTTIGKWAFEGCTKLKSIEIPDSVTTIGDAAFSSCDRLRSVKIGDSVTQIGSYAFLSCESLTSVEIGDSVATIGDHAFYWCIKLTSIEIPDSVTTIGNSAFYECDSLTSVEIGDSVTTIGNGAFDGCTGLTSVEIPDSVTTIGNSAFWGCTGLTSVLIGNSVTIIGNSAFSNCTNLTRVEIPDSVTTIDSYAFYGCDSLTDVYYAGSEAEWKKISIGSSNQDLTGATIHYNYQKPTTKTYIMALYPEKNQKELSSVLDLTICFNTTVKLGKGNVYIKEYKTDKTVKTLDISKWSHNLGSNTIDFVNINLEAGKTYYVTMDTGAVIGTGNLPFYGIHDKKTWKFSTSKDKALQKTTYVGLEYEKEGNLLWKTDNTDLPPIPKGSDDDYGRELDSWAIEFGVNNIHNSSNKGEILDMPVKIPVTDTNGQTFLLDDKATTVKQVMQDLIFIQHLQPYIEKMDKKFKELTVGASGGMEVVNYGTEREIYNLAESYAVELNKYLDSRVGKEKSSLFLSVAAPLMYTTLINTITNGQGEMESNFIRTYADAIISKNVLQEHINSIYGTSDYNTYKQGLSDLKNYIKIGKELYKISTKGVSSSTVKLGKDMLSLYLKDQGISIKSKTLNMISETWSEFMTSKSCAQMSMFLGNSLGYFPYVVELNTKLSKMVADTAKAWYFVADYCISPEYPELIERVMDENYILDKNYDYAWDVNYNIVPDNNIAKNWLYQTNHTRSVLLDTENIISTRRDMTNAANFFNFAKIVDIDEAKQCLLNYISAELNKGKTTEVYGKCPIKINIYDKENKLIATLSSDDENDNNTEYGSFYLLGDDNNTKYFILSSDEYRMEIVPYADGEMDIAITQKDENGEILKSSYYDNVSIASNEVYNADLSLEKPVLVKDDAALDEDTALVESVSISSLDDEIACGKTLSLNALVYPEFAGDKTVIWNVYNEDVATIDQNGVLTGISEGVVCVTATASNGVMDAKIIKVYTPVESIVSEESELVMTTGEEYSLELSVAPSSAISRTIKWTSSDSSVASVDEEGTVIAKGKGEAIITASADGVTKEFFVEVTNDILNIIMNQSDSKGDRVKLDIQNMSSKNNFEGNIYFGLYKNNILMKLVKYPVTLEKQESFADYINVQLNEGNYEIKAFVWNDNLMPLQKAKKLTLIKSQTEE